MPRTCIYQTRCSALSASFSFPHKYSLCLHTWTPWCPAGWFHSAECCRHSFLPASVCLLICIQAQPQCTGKHGSLLYSPEPPVEKKQKKDIFRYTGVTARKNPQYMHCGNSIWTSRQSSELNHIQYITYSRNCCNFLALAFELTLSHKNVNTATGDKIKLLCISTYILFLFYSS